MLQDQNNQSLCPDLDMLINLPKPSQQSVTLILCKSATNVKVLSPVSTPNISASVTDAVVDDISPVPSPIASPSFNIVPGLDDVDDERLSAEEPVALLSPSIIHTSESEGGYGIDGVNSDPNDETHGADPITVGIKSGDDEQSDGNEYHPQEESGSEAGSGTEAEALELNIDLKEEFAKFLESHHAKKEHKATKNPTKNKSDHKVNWIHLYRFLTSLH